MDPLNASGPIRSVDTITIYWDYFTLNSWLISLGLSLSNSGVTPSPCRKLRLCIMNAARGKVSEMVPVERFTRVVTLILNGKQINILNSDGFFDEGEFSPQEVTQLIHHPRSQGWDLISATTRRSADTGQQYMDMFFRRK